VQWNKGRVSEDSDKFRNMAARSLRAARATSDAAFRQTCFAAAAIYKRFALEDEILKGERQRSGPRKMEQLLPQAPLRSDDIQIACEPRDSEAVGDAVTLSEPGPITNSGPDAIAKAGGLQ
jgi:hypothetical protein